VKSAMNVRHPLDPIGSSDSAAFQWFFLAILLVTLLMAMQVVRWFHAPDRGREREAHPPLTPPSREGDVPPGR
jgi:hypothetical protein